MLCGKLVSVDFIDVIWDYCRKYYKRMWQNSAPRIKFLTKLTLLDKQHFPIDYHESIVFFFESNFSKSIFPMAKLKMSDRWFRQWLSDNKRTAQYLSWWWTNLLPYISLGIGLRWCFSLLVVDEHFFNSSIIADVGVNNIFPQIKSYFSTMIFLIKLSLLTDQMKICRLQRSLMIV